MSERTAREEKDQERRSTIADTFAGSFIDDDEALKRLNFKTKESFEEEKRQSEAKGERFGGKAKQEMEHRSQQDMYTQRGNRRVPESFTVKPNFNGPEFD